MHVDVALELLVDAVHLGVIFQGVDFALLQGFGEEFYRLLHHLHVAMVEHLLQTHELLIARTKLRLGGAPCLLHLQLCALAALLSSPDVLAVAVKRKAHAHKHSVHRFLLLRVAAVAERDVGQPFPLLHLHVHVCRLQHRLSHQYVGIRGEGKCLVRLEVGYRLELRNLHIVDGHRLSAVELRELLQQEHPLVLRLAHQGLHLHAVELHLVHLQYVGVASLHALVVHLPQRFAVL